VNTTNTRVELTFSIENSRSLGPRQKSRLIAKLGPSVRVVATDRRSQFQNRQLARERLAKKLGRALEVEKKRTPTKKTKGSNEARLRSKRRRSEIKKLRRPKDYE
jgi:ribosome-associated protein